MVTEYFEDFKKVALGQLKKRYHPHQKDLPKWLPKRHQSGKFRRIVRRSEPTVIRLRDGGAVGYRVPAALVCSDLQHAKSLENWVAECGPRAAFSRDLVRDVLAVRYAIWSKTNEGGVPGVSADYQQDGALAEEFFTKSKFLWAKAKDWFPQHHHPRAYQDLNQFRTREINADQKLCGLWMGCAINMAEPEKPVQTKPHHDPDSFFYGMSCLCPFGEFTGGGLILWELDAVVELKRGDLFFFMDHLLTHSNEKAYGTRHSVVAFSDGGVWEWMQKEFNFDDKRIKRKREAEDEYQKRQKMKRRESGEDEA